ncbi:low temperature requirement protein A [Streptomyces sp. NBC_00237]|uniref:low temperature requirement protein A n=1 Tax=Streptomyces sp. NBC_00237 TaxID=2975687 RepID=UPI00224E646B|nr:low temperature requirement protein A [Streptomyces sp. NBC_00237]MCX5200650.1 low temperature requirement protein A [Streptomyces sp. NBC_00237]
MSHPTAPTGLLRRMTSRSPEEGHRAATALELFFDLCFVVAVAQAGARLVHADAEAHIASGVLGYFLVFFAIWWAWMNFTWFASAYDNDDVFYRVAVLVQIAGILVFAAGIPRAFDNGDWTIGIIGYVVMRLAMTFQWLRVARHNTGAERSMALKYALGLAICQVGWVAVIFLPDGARPYLFAVLVLAELSVPPLAEKGFRTSWHPHHIAERYSLFTIIVLGESITAATIAVQKGLDERDELGELLAIAGGGLLIVFAAWWIYFSSPAHERLTSMKRALQWGYGHFFILASAAAIGAGIEVAVEQDTGEAHISSVTAAAAVTVPTALFLFTCWLLQARHFKRDAAEKALMPVTVVLVLACTFLGIWGVLAAGIVMAVAVTVGVLLSNRPDSASLRTPQLT